MGESFDCKNSSNSIFTLKLLMPSLGTNKRTEKDTGHNHLSLSVCMCAHPDHALFLFIFYLSLCFPPPAASVTLRIRTGRKKWSLKADTDPEQGWNPLYPWLAALKGVIVRSTVFFFPCSSLVMIVMLSFNDNDNNNNDKTFFFGGITT